MGLAIMVSSYSIEVVMPTYNGIDFVEAQIASIYNQTLRPSKLIIRDDFSTDGTTQLLAKLAVKWTKNDNIGLVVGATKPEEIERVRKIANNLPMLIPGIGAQGGDLKKSMKYGNKNGVALINISRGISFAGDLSTSAIKDSAKQFLQKMREYN